MKTVFHWTVETWWIVVLRRDVQYFLRAYEFDAKIICVVILCKFCEEFFIKIFVFSTVIILFPMASNVLQPGKITTKKPIDVHLSKECRLNRKNAGECCKYGNT